ncbi:MAG: hypothetical protein RLZZ301_1549 [Bacteroidota bacterium]
MRIFSKRIDGFAEKNRHLNAKVVANYREKDTKCEAPLVFQEVFVDVAKRLHGFFLLLRGYLQVQK